MLGRLQHARAGVASTLTQRLRAPASPLLSTAFRRHESVQAGSLREGELVVEESGLWRVVSRAFSRTAQGRAYIQAEIRHISEPVKRDVRWRSDELVERAEMDKTARVTVLYLEGDVAHVMDSSTFEQTELKIKELLGERAAFVQPEMALSVDSYKGVPCLVGLPTRVTLTVTGMDDLGNADTDSGLPIRVPRHVKVGDKIVIDPQDSRYVSKEGQ